MTKFKNMKSILLTTGITIGLTLSISTSAFATTYTTVSGDSLYKISQLFNTTVASLIVNNSLTNTSLSIGQELDVSNFTHTVKKGDTLYLISLKYKVTLSDLRRANNIYTNIINIGQKLYIPTKSEHTKPETTDTSLNTNITYSDEDLDILSRLITAEAQSQSYETKVAVGAVVLNRIKDNSFPNSIKEVVYQVINGYYQFTPVLTGWINEPAHDDCIKAAKEALSGVDPTNGALFFFDNTVTNTWLLARTVSITSDIMIFSY